MLKMHASQNVTENFQETT